MKKLRVFRAISNGIVGIALFSSFAACSRDELKIETYKTAKQAAPQQMSMPMGAPDSAPMGAVPAQDEASAFAWDIPKGWNSQPGSSMRLVSFGVPGGDTSQGSIIALEGDAGGLVANVNRWRQQVGLAAQDERAIMATARKAKSTLGEFLWFEIVNEQSSDKAMLVAVAPAGRKTLFVKLMAPKSTLQKYQEKFLSLCRSLRPADAKKTKGA